MIINKNITKRLILMLFLFAVPLATCGNTSVGNKQKSKTKKKNTRIRKEKSEVIYGASVRRSPKIRNLNRFLYHNE